MEQGRHIAWVACVACALMLLVAWPRALRAQEVAYEPDELLLSVDSAADPQAVEELLRQTPGVVAHEVAAEELASGVLCVELEADASVEEAVNDLLFAAPPEVTGAQPNYVYGLAEEAVEGGLAAELSAELMPQSVTTAFSLNDSSRSRLWGLTSLRAYEAWSVARCEGQVSVAVIDNGFDVEHADLAANVVAGSAYNAYAVRVGDEELLYDVSVNNGNRHGTHVAGIVGAVANNALGVAGISYNAGIVPIKSFSPAGTTTTADLVAAYDYLMDVADDYNIRVVNMSIGGPVDSADFTDDELIGRVEAAAERGIVTVAAACNSSSNDYEVPFYAYPGDADSIVSVINLGGITTSANEGDDASGSFEVYRSDTSNYNVAGQGSAYTTSGKNISAPGESIYSTFPGGTYGYTSGTSMASPYVAGVVALEFAANPGLSAWEATSILYASAHDVGAAGWDEETGWGEADAAAAVDFCLSGAEVQVEGLGTLQMDLVLPAEGYEFDHAAKEPDVTATLVGDATVTLVRGTDFGVSYANNVDAGVATVTVSGTGAYAGLFAEDLHFTIGRRPLQGVQITLDASELSYDARALTPEVAEVADGGVALTQGVDFCENLTYANNINVGTATATIHGLGNYVGSASTTFRVVPRDLNDVVVGTWVDEATYTGSACEPAMNLVLEQRAQLADGGSSLLGTYTLMEGTDFAVTTWANNVNAGVATVTVEGAGNFSGTRAIDFAIAHATVEVPVGNDLIYTGARQVGVEAAEGYELSGTTRATNAGTYEATATLSDAQNYRWADEDEDDEHVAARTVAFSILPVSLASCDMALAGESFSYTGEAIEPAATLTYGTLTLAQGTDYTLSYANNVEVGVATLTAKGTGNYTGTLAATFRITPHSINDAATVAVEVEAEVPYTGSGAVPEVVVTYSSDGETRTLAEGEDYAVLLADNVEVGEATALIEGLGDFGDVREEGFRVVRATVEVPEGAEGLVYTGKEQVGVTAGEGYELSGVTSATDAGDYVATATLADASNYQWADGTTGARRVSWQIAPAQITAVTASAQTYTGRALTTTLTVRAGKLTVPAEGYATSYEDNINAGMATVTVTGTGNYGGSAYTTFVIKRTSVAAPTAGRTLTYTGKVQSGVVAGSGYKLTGTTKATDAGSYYAIATLADKVNNQWADGSVTDKLVSWKISPVAVTSVAVSQKLTYTGSALKPVPTVKAGSLTVPASGYSASYSNNTKVGTATVKVSGTGNFKGLASGTFAIGAASIAKATIATIAAQAYTAKAITPAPAVTLAGKTLKKGTDYTLSYTANTKVGTATITATGKGNYTGTRKATFAIVAPTVMYRVHRQTYGWETSWVTNGATSGTTGESKRLEGIYIKLGSGFPVAGGIKYRTHVQTYGWEKTWAADGSLSGTTGESKRLEAIQIKLTGAMANKYDVWYRVHAQRLGWMGWAKNGASAGTAGYSYRLEAIQIRLVPKGGAAPGSTARAFVQK